MAYCGGRPPTACSDCGEVKEQTVEVVLWSEKEASSLPRSSGAGGIDEVKQRVLGLRPGATRPHFKPCVVHIEQNCENERINSSRTVEQQQ